MIFFIECSWQALTYLFPVVGCLVCFISNQTSSFLSCSILQAWSVDTSSACSVGEIIWPPKSLKKEWDRYPLRFIWSRTRGFQRAGNDVCFPWKYLNWIWIVQSWLEKAGLGISDSETVYSVQLWCSLFTTTCQQQHLEAFHVCYTNILYLYICSNCNGSCELKQWKSSHGDELFCLLSHFFSPLMT